MARPFDPLSQLGVARFHGTRQDTFEMEVFLNGNSMGIWDKKTGGELDSEETKYYPGGMADAVSLGGRVTQGNITLQRLYDRVLDHNNMQSWFDQVGRGGVKVHQHAMDIQGNRYGNAVIWAGTLKRVQAPDVDSESSSAALFEIEVTVAQKPVLVSAPI
jgi:hypothetical protein